MPFIIGENFVKYCIAVLESTSMDWHKIVYGDASSHADLKWLPLRKSGNAYYARNSKGKLKPVIEEGWDANANPTHVIVMISSGSGEPFVGTEGLNLYVDNIGFQL